MIQWISEEVLQKEEVLAESNCNDYLSYQDREELERKGEKKNSDRSQQARKMEKRK